MEGHRRDDSLAVATTSAIAPRIFSGFVRVVVPDRTWLIGAAWPASVALAIRVLADQTRSMLFSLALFALLGVPPPLVLLRVLWRRIATSQVLKRLALEAHPPHAHRLRQRREVRFSWPRTTTRTDVDLARELRRIEGGERAR